MPRGRYGIKAGGTSYLYFSANKTSYDGLEETLGLTDVSGSGFEGTIDRINTRSKLRSRVAVRYSLADTAGGASSRVVRLWCATDKLNAALAALPKQSYKGKNIIDAYIPNRYSIG